MSHVVKIGEFHLEVVVAPDAVLGPGPLTIEPFSSSFSSFSSIVLFLTPPLPAPGLRPGEPYHPLGESDREHDPVEQARAISTSSYSRACVSMVKFKPRKVMRQGYTSRSRLFRYCREEKGRKHMSMPKASFHVRYLEPEFLVFFSVEPVAVPRICSAKVALSISY